MPMRKKRCRISGKSVLSLDEFYDEIARQLGFPDHFGRNLDALWDLLATDIEGPVELVWDRPESSRLGMGQDFDRLLSVLHDVEKARRDFRVRLVKQGGKRGTDPGRIGRS